MKTVELHDGQRVLVDMGGEEQPLLLLPRELMASGGQPRRVRSRDLLSRTDRPVVEVTLDPDGPEVARWFEGRDDRDDGSWDDWDERYPVGPGVVAVACPGNYGGWAEFTLTPYGVRVLSAEQAAAGGEVAGFRVPRQE